MKKLTLMLAGALVLALGVSKPALAQEWPQKNIRIIVAFGPGGGTDIIGRILAEAIAERLGKPIVIENRPGAGGTLGNEAVANADADGYTLGIMTAGQIIAAVTKKDMRYDTLTAFAPIGHIATASLLIVTRPDFAGTSAKDLVAAAKADPGKITYASPGFAATQHFAGEMFKQIGKVNMLHVPYRTSPEAISALLGKHADVLFDTVSAVLSQVQSGQLKALAVTGKDRFPAVPNVPPAIESGVLPGYDVTTWYGMFAPAKTPPAVIAKLNKAMNDSLADENVRKRLVTAGVVVQSSTPEVFGKFLADEYKRWDSVREGAGIARQ